MSMEGPESKISGMDAPSVTWAAMIFSARVLHGLAIEAYQRLSSVESDTALGRNDALFSILFSAATLEAAINEFAAAATFDGQLGHAALATAGAMLSEIESSNGSPKLKIDVAHFVLSGNSYNRG